MKRFAVLFSVLIFTGSICLAQGNAPADQAKGCDKSEGKEKNSGYDRPLKITFKPRPRWPEGFHGQGTVTLRIQFLDSGEIGKISPVSELPRGATEMAIEAAKGIKFRPAQLKGKPVTVHKVLQFTFSIY